MLAARPLPDLLRGLLIRLPALLGPARSLPTVPARRDVLLSLSTLLTGGLSPVALRAGLDGTLAHVGLLLAATPLSGLIAPRRERLVTGGVLTSPLLPTVRVRGATLLATLSLELLVPLSSRLGIRPSLWRRLSVPGPRRLLAGGLRRRLVPGLRWPLAVGGLGLLALARWPCLSSSSLSRLPSLRSLGSSPRWLLALWRLLVPWRLLAPRLSVLRWLLGLPRSLSFRRSLARRGLGITVLLPAGRRSLAGGLLRPLMPTLGLRSGLLTGLLRLAAGSSTGLLPRPGLAPSVALGLWRLLPLVRMLPTGLVLLVPRLVLHSRGSAPRPALLDTGLLSTLLLWRRLAPLLAAAVLVRAALGRLLPPAWLAGLGRWVLLSPLLLSAPTLLVRRLPTALLIASTIVLSASALGAAVLLVHVVARLKVRGGAIKRRPPFTRVGPESPR